MYIFTDCMTNTGLSRPSISNFRMMRLVGVCYTAGFVLSGIAETLTVPVTPQMQGFLPEFHDSETAVILSYNLIVPISKMRGHPMHRVAEFSPEALRDSDMMLIETSVSPVNESLEAGVQGRLRTSSDKAIRATLKPYRGKNLSLGSNTALNKDSLKKKARRGSKTKYGETFNGEGKRVSTKKSSESLTRTKDASGSTGKSAQKANAPIFGSRGANEVGKPESYANGDTSVFMILSDQSAINNDKPTLASLGCASRRLEGLIHGNKPSRLGAQPRAFHAKPTRRLNNLADCIVHNWRYAGIPLAVENTSSLHDCQNICLSLPGCDYLSFKEDTQRNCAMFAQHQGLLPDLLTISGPTTCGLYTDTNRAQNFIHNWNLPPRQPLSARGAAHSAPSVEPFAHKLFWPASTQRPPYPLGNTGFPKNYKPAAFKDVSTNKNVRRRKSNDVLTGQSVSLPNASSSTPTSQNTQIQSQTSQAILSEESFAPNELHHSSNGTTNFDSPPRANHELPLADSQSNTPPHLHNNSVPSDSTNFATSSQAGYASHSHGNDVATNGQINYSPGSQRGYVGHGQSHNTIYGRGGPSSQVVTNAGGVPSRPMYPSSSMQTYPGGSHASVQHQTPIYGQGTGVPAVPPYPGVTSANVFETAQAMVDAGNAFITAFPVQQVFETGSQLFNAGFFRNRGMTPLGTAMPAAPVGMEKQLLLPPPGAGKPTVTCHHQGMTCCVPEDAITDWRTKPPYLNNHDSKECKGIFVPAKNAVCATTAYDSKSNCGLSRTETEELIVHRHVLTLPSKGANNAICECHTQKNQESGDVPAYQGNAGWEYSLSAISSQQKNQIQGDTLAKGMVSALDWASAINQHGSAALNNFAAVTDPGYPVA